MKSRAKAFAPAAISSFFEICDQTPSGKPIRDIEFLGARGGGFGLQKGVTTEITVTDAQTQSIQVTINGLPAPEAKTTEMTLQMVLSKAKGTYSVVACHETEVPIGAGFGTSAGGALTAGLALKQALNLPLTTDRIGKMAHAAEIQCQTGLGTVSSLAQIGGCVLVLSPGAPGFCQLDSIPLTPDHVVVAGVFESTPKSNLLSSPDKKYEINRYGRKTLDSILAEPSLENFLASCWQFAQDAGFATDRVKTLVAAAIKAKAVGAAQNMIGEAVHAVALEENAVDVAEAFKQVLPKEKVFISKIDFQGARLTGKA